MSETTPGDRKAQTINIRDFNRLIAYGLTDGKQAAIALQPRCNLAHNGQTQYPQARSPQC